MQHEQKQMQRVLAQLERMERLYARMGMPLSANVRLELCRHLGTALRLDAREKCRDGRSKDA